MSMMPPKKRDWKKGTSQIGVFLRTKEGNTINLVCDQATEDDVLFTWFLIRGLKDVPENVLKQLRELQKKFLDEYAATSSKGFKKKG